MKRRKRLPIPQYEFGFTPQVFNLIQETSLDGERMTRERAELDDARRRCDRAQTKITKLLNP